MSTSTLRAQLAQDASRSRDEALRATAGIPQALQLIEADYRQMFNLRHPAKMAIWLALLRKDGELARREEEFMADPCGSERPAILAYAEALVLRAIRGDPAAGAVINDRIEGKAGPRLGDEAESNAARRIGVISALTEAVETMTDHKIESSKLIIQEAEVTGITPVARNADPDGQPLRFYDSDADEQPRRANGMT